MNSDFNEEHESRILAFIHRFYGAELFTPGLERTQSLFTPFLKRVKNENVKVTIISGTNGKGQTAHTLVCLLEGAQLNTALWTSPHILSIRERFHFRGSDLTYDELEFEVLETHRYLQNLFLAYKISFYEFLFLVFLRCAFDSKKNFSIQHLVLEVGLGGRLDAVNHFDADCACITSISRDHQSILGTRYDMILSEKIAVSRKGKPLFTQFRLEYLNQSVEQYCKEYGVQWRPCVRDLSSSVNYFEENQKMAYELFSFLAPLKKASSKELIPLFKGRREEMTFKENDIIFIGAHNIDGIRRMIELFRTEDCFVRSFLPSKVLLSFSKRPSNELEVMFKTLVDFFGRESTLLLTSFVHPKAAELSDIVELVDKFNKMNKGLFDFVTDWKNEINISKNQKILVCGSYYFIGEVQRFILQPS
jgi:dihydrofolate synthase/folylpolyglutamate synthase